MAPPLSPSPQIKEFSDPSASDTAKDQLSAAAAAAAPGTVAAAAKQLLDIPAVQVIPHALAKLEKPADEMYTVSLNAFASCRFRNISLERHQDAV